MIKKGIFGIFGGNKHLEEEEELQQQHAMSMKREEDLEESGEDEASIVTNDIVSFSSRKLEYLLTEMGESITVKFKKRDRYKLFLEVVGTEDMGRIIGKEGMTLGSLQVLVKAFVMKEFSVSIQVIIDAGGYRNRRSKKLKERVLKAAKDVIRDNSNVELESMNSVDRRMVHMLFEHDQEIDTYSVGEGRERRVVLSKKGNEEPS